MWKNPVLMVSCNVVALFEVNKDLPTSPLPLQYGHFDLLESGSLLVPEHRSHTPCTRNDSSRVQPSTTSLNDRFSETLQH